MTRIKIKAEPSIGKVRAWFNKVESFVVDNAERAYEVYILDHIRAMHQELFKSQGRKFGTGIWRRLESKYAAWKQEILQQGGIKQTAFGKEMISSVGSTNAVLVLGGQLAESTFRKEAAAHIEEISGSQLTYGTRHPLAWLHSQIGITRKWTTGEVVKRHPLIDPNNPAVEERIGNAVAQWLEVDIPLLEKEL